MVSLHRQRKNIGHEGEIGGYGASALARVARHAKSGGPDFNDFQSASLVGQRKLGTALPSQLDRIISDHISGHKQCEHWLERLWMDKGM